MSSSSDSTSARSRDQMVDLEHLPSNGTRDSKRQRHLVRIFRVPVPVREGRIVSDLFKYLALLMTAACISQAVYIHNLQAGLVRVPNDPFDNTFWETEWHSPSVWDSSRQEFLHNAKPVPVHSHNDYWRAIPVHEALASGCISLEADVHLDGGGELYVGHASAGGGGEHTLRAMYLEPLQRMLDAQNAGVAGGGGGGGRWRGIFNQSPQQTVVLLIDIKTDGARTFAALDAQLQGLRERDYLTYWDGAVRVTRPITVVASGNAPFGAVTALDPAHRDIFWDAKLERLLSADDDFAADPPVYGYNESNSYYASTSFSNARLYPAWHNGTGGVEEPTSAVEKHVALSQLDQARARGLISRYWDLPTHPPNLKEIVWRVLVDLEVGVLNMDDLGAVRARAHGWGQI